ncbi:interaptin-like [Trifolium pratense]|uniref:interaptin-like n=1 Tax=Trifolium pratense TaxID=57577 RepID=UPI001E697DBA|nr:interaptin-like [Trifolium pratense]
MELEHLIQEKKNEYNALLQELQFLQNSIDQCRIKRREEEELLELKHKQLASIRHKLNLSYQDVDSKNREFDSLRRSMRETYNEFDKKDRRLREKAKDIENQENDLERKEMNYQVRVKVLEIKEERCKAIKSKEKLFEERVKDLDLKEEQYEEKVKELYLKEKKFVEEQVNVHEERVKDLESKEKRFEERLNELYSKEEELVKVHEGRLKDLELKERQFEQRVKDFDSKEVQRVKAHERRVKDLELKEKKFVERVKDFDSKEVQRVKAHEGRVKDLELKEKKFVESMQELESQKEGCEIERKELKSKEEQFEGRMKKHESNEKEFDERVKVLVSMEKQFEGQMKDLDLKERIDGRMKDLDSMEKQIEEQMKDLESKKNRYEEQVRKLESQVKELELKEKQLKLQVKDLETKQNQFEDNIENVQFLNNLVEKHELICSQISDVLQTSPDPAKLVLDTIKGFRPSQHERTKRNLLVDELNKTSSVISFQVKEEAIKFASEWKANLVEAAKDCLEVLNYFKFVATYDIGSYCQVPQFLSGTELNGNGFLVHLQTSSDPAELVLEMIQNPMLRRDEGIIIDKGHICLLDQLMRISPQIKPHVQEMAMKLALELKDIASRIAESSLVILGFLLLLFNYRLFSRFNFDEYQVLNLFEFVAHHKEAVELFQTFGFVDKISDFVENLITKQRYIGAVRFICAFKLADKFHLVNLLLRQHLEYTKLKVVARDVEIASLGDILECISDYSLESQDLVNEIRARIFVLEQEKQKENIVDIASSSTSQVRVQKPQEKKRGYEAVLANNSKHPRIDVPSSSS